MRLSGYLIERTVKGKRDGFCAYDSVNDVMRELRTQFFHAPGNDGRSLELTQVDASMMLSNSGVVEVTVPGTQIVFHVRRFN